MEMSSGQSDTQVYKTGERFRLEKDTWKTSVEREYLRIIPVLSRKLGRSSRKWTETNKT